MSSKSMAHKFIELDPPYNLVFQRPFNTPKTQVLKIKNITDSTIVFKVKTTAPNSYIVVPNCGEIKANSFREIEIKHNSTNEEFPPDFKCKDKFLVQSMKINDDEIQKYGSNQKELQKYLMAEFQEMDKLKKISPADAKAVLGEDRLTCTYALPNEVINQEARSIDLGSSHESLSSTTADATSSVTAVPGNVPSSFTRAATAMEIDELEAAREKIKELQQALKGFKQDQAIKDLTKGSTTAARDVKATPVQAQLNKSANKNVIPVEIVALVALLAFLIGAFCF